jgi:hypothetical protein
LEFAEGHFIRANQIELSNLMIAEFGEEKLYVEFGHSNGMRGMFTFPRENQCVYDYVKTLPEGTAYQAPPTLVRYDRRVPLLALRS